MLCEAFRCPPRSAGRSFDTFTLFELIRRLEKKEIKIWAELSSRAGIESPDRVKGESNQRLL